MMDRVTGTRFSGLEVTWGCSSSWGGYIIIRYYKLWGIFWYPSMGVRFFMVIPCYTHPPQLHREVWSSKWLFFQPGIQKKHGVNKGFTSNLDGYLPTDVDIRGYMGYNNEYDQTWGTCPQFIYAHDMGQIWFAQPRGGMGNPPFLGKANGILELSDGCGLETF